MHTKGKYLLKEHFCTAPYEADFMISFGLNDRSTCPDAKGSSNFWQIKQY